MKIIGKGEGEVLIVEMRKEELANLHGEYSSYNMKVEVGMTFGVTDLFQKARETIEAYGEIRKSLSALKNHTDKILAAMGKKVEKVNGADKK